VATTAHPGDARERRMDDCWVMFIQRVRLFCTDLKHYKPNNTPAIGSHIRSTGKDLPILSIKFKDRVIIIYNFELKNSKVY
jgi:hypothetical protein